MAVIPVKIPHRLASKPCFIDDEDYSKCSVFNWYLDPNGYVYSGGKSSGTVKIHRLIAGCKKGDGLVVDHRDFDKLNNQKTNLRVCTYSQNGANAQKQKRRNGTSSKFRGVSWARQYKKWSSMLTKDRKTVFLKFFDDEVEAAKAYDQAALKHFGEFGSLNFPL